MRREHLEYIGAPGGLENYTARTFTCTHGGDNWTEVFVDGEWHILDEGKELAEIRDTSIEMFIIDFGAPTSEEEKEQYNEEIGNHMYRVAKDEDGEKVNDSPGIHGKEFTIVFDAPTSFLDKVEKEYEEVHRRGLEETVFGPDWIDEAQELLEDLEKTLSERYEEYHRRRIEEARKRYEEYYGRAFKIEDFEIKYEGVVEKNTHSFLPENVQRGECVAGLIKTLLEIEEWEPEGMSHEEFEDYLTDLWTGRVDPSDHMLTVVDLCEAQRNVEEKLRTYQEEVAKNSNKAKKDKNDWTFS